MDPGFQALLHEANSQVNPVLDELHNAFDEFVRVVRARPSVTTEAMCEEIREQLVQSVTMVTREMNTGNVALLMEHLRHAQYWTHLIHKFTPHVRYQHEIRGFFVQNE